MSFITSPGVVGYSNQIATAAPNNVIPVSYFIAIGGAADVDAAIGPKGAGALLAQIPDGANAGGNKRGSRAVDLQLQRTANTQVASGNNSGVLSGLSNTASNLRSVVAGGNQNANGGQDAGIVGGNLNVVSGAGTLGFIGGGQSNTVSNSRGAIAGGDNNTASGVASMVPGGSTCVASGDYSSAWGQNAITRGVQGAVAFSSRMNGTPGDNQTTFYQGLALTTDATPTVLTADKAAAAASNAMTFPDKSLIKFQIDAIGYDHTTGDYRVVKFEGLFNRQTGVATSTIAGLVTTVIGSSGGGAGWAITCTANVGRGGIDVTVTGAAATNVRWGYSAYCREVTL